MRRQQLKLATRIRAATHTSYKLEWINRCHRQLHQVFVCCLRDGEKSFYETILFRTAENHACEREAKVKL